MAFRRKISLEAHFAIGQRLFGFVIEEIQLPDVSKAMIHVWRDTRCTAPGQYGM